MLGRRHSPGSNIWSLTDRLALLAILGCAIVVCALPRNTLSQTSSRPPSRGPRAGDRSGSSGDWLLWGGPRHDFIAPSTGLAATWPPDGPRKLWTRVLGDGYSAVAVEGTTLYTAHRRGSQDVIVALDSRTAATIWEHAYEAPFQNSYVEAVGPGPYAMPQVVGDRIVTASGTGKIHSLDKKTGRPVWSHDLYTEFGGTPLEFGYSCHALPYKDTLILLAGGRSSAVLAFRQSDGAVVWQGLSFQNAHSSPMLIEVDGQQQVIVRDRHNLMAFDLSGK